MEKKTDVIWHTPYTTLYVINRQHPKHDGETGKVYTKPLHATMYVWTNRPDIVGPEQDIQKARDYVDNLVHIDVPALEHHTNQHQA